MKNKKNKNLEGLWAGSEASLQDYLLRMEQMGERLAAGWQAQEENEEELPYLLDIQGDVGLIQIAGPLTYKDDEWLRYFGVTSYGAIREAVIAAASHAEVKHIVLDINSGGGTVNGVSDVANLIRTINDKVKPVTAFTDGAMCSAAYWLGCAAGDVFSTEVSTVGSIGVIATHMEYSKQLANDGVAVTVFRGGKYKALINAVEPLTDAAKTQMQAQLDVAYKVFVQHVARMRNQPYDHTDADMAQGREFFGEQAFTAGLVDGIKSFDEVVSGIKAKMLDNPAGFFNNQHQSVQGTDNMKKKAFTLPEVAALAEGAAAATASDTRTPEEIAAAEAQAVADAAAAAALAQAAAGEPAAEPAAETDPVTEKDENQLVAFLQSQVKEKDGGLLTAHIEIKGLKDKLSDQEASHASLMEIAVRSCANMQVALGGSAADMAGMTATAVLAEHKRLGEQFQSKFKAGGVAAVAAAVASKGDDVVVDPLQRARLAAVRSTAKKAK